MVYYSQGGYYVLTGKSDDLDRNISAISKRLHLKRSDVVRMALERFLQEFQNPILMTRLKD
jgi:metal-responsive CopG/Arc/MetJ family transcriptional regulator